MTTGAETLQQISTTLQAGSGTLKSMSGTLQDIGTTLRSGNEMLNKDVKTSANLKLATDTLRTFGELKFWLSDLEVSWLNESEENAETAREQLDKLLQNLGKIVPEKDVRTIRENVEALYDMSIEAVDAYVDENRVLGNSKVAKARENIKTVDDILLMHS